MNSAYSVYDLVEIPKTLSEELSRAIREACDAIASVHSLPKRVRVAFTEMPKRNRHKLEGLYSARGSEVTIAINPRATEPRLTVLHEFGHYLDDLVLHPLKGAWASHYDIQIEPLIEACLATPSSVALGGILRHRGRRMEPAERASLREFQMPHELFARSYAQWITMRSESEILNAELHRRISRNYSVGGIPLPLQWDEREFVSIMHAMNELFRKRGYSCL